MQSRPPTRRGWGRRPTADRRSLSRKAATSMALQGFTSSRAGMAGLMLAPSAGGARGGQLGVTIRGVRRLRDVKEAQALSVALH